MKNGAEKLRMLLTVQEKLNRMAKNLDQKERATTSELES